MTRKTKSKTVKKTKVTAAELEDFSIQVNEFGQVIKNFDIDKINTFLNENVPDKKLNE